jgi:hypothetical protein
MTDVSALNGQRALLEAKMKEFEGLRMIGNMAAAEKCREDAHALLDAWFDGQASFAEDVRRGRYM